MADGIVSNPRVPEVHEHIAATPARGHVHDGLAWHRHQYGVAYYGEGFRSSTTHPRVHEGFDIKRNVSSLSTTAAALERLHWVERQVIELAREWLGSSETGKTGCGAAILSVIDRSHAEGGVPRETAEDHAFELERHARALIAEVLDLRELQHAASSSLAGCSMSERGEAHGGHLWRAHGGVQYPKWCPGIRKDPA